MVAVILLGIVFGFMVYEWNGYWSGVEERQDLSHHQEPNRTHKSSEDEDHEHDEHHYHHDQHGEDDDHHEDHDHDHKDEHNHNNGSHTHEHSQPLYHNAAIITDSGMTPFIDTYNENVYYDRKSINMYQNIS